MQHVSSEEDMKTKSRNDTLAVPAFVPSSQQKIIELSDTESVCSHVGSQAKSTPNVASLPAETDEELRMKKEKRLAMNRASARARRKRKKDMLVSLINQVTELTKQNQTIEAANGSLQARATELETALAQAQRAISAIVRDASRQITPPQSLILQTIQTDLSAVSALQQESLRSVPVQAVTPVASAVGTSSLVETLAQQELLKAQLLARENQNRAQPLTLAAVLGNGGVKINLSQLGAAIAPAAPL